MTATEPTNAVFEEVKRYDQAGLSVIPIKIDGSKQPSGCWKKQQASRSSFLTYYWQFKDRPTEQLPGIGIVCGKVSGNLELLDFDRGELFKTWSELVEKQCPGLVARLSIVETPREPAGYHARYRCKETTIPGNLKLAQEPITDPATGKSKTVTLIETRGEGGQALAPGGNPRAHPTGRPYKHYGGPGLTDLPVITANEREILIGAARSFDRSAEPKKKPASSTPGPPSSNGHTNGNTAAAGSRPGDQYDLNGPPWPEILTPHGWDVVFSRGDADYLRRPGKDTPGISATAGYCHGHHGEPLLFVFSSNADPFENGQSYGRFRAFTLLNHGGDYKAAAKALAAQGYGERRRSARRSSGAVSPPVKEGGATAHEPSAPNHTPVDGECGGRLKIVVDTNEHLVNSSAVFAIARDTTIYQRGGSLVHVVRSRRPGRDPNREPILPRIERLPPPMVRDRLAANIEFLKPQTDKEGNVVSTEPQHVPGWCVQAVHARGEWDHVRPLEAVVEFPILRPDGTVLTQPGYDETTGLLLCWPGTPLDIPDQPTLDDAVKARDALLNAVIDFPFGAPYHRSGWLAALLTPAARHAYRGSTPLFLADANVRAAGKGKLLETIAYILTGEPFPTAGYSDRDEEMEKRLTALAVAGDSMVLWDNISGRFGGSALDRALTSTVWEGRILGESRNVRLPFNTIMYGTGNNIQVHADTERRISHIRLESPEEKPEERQGFQHPDLLDWVLRERHRFLAAVLTILRAYCVAGYPDQNLPTWGSFEGWSKLIRNVITWVGMPDPYEARHALREGGDTPGHSIATLLTIWHKLDPNGDGLTASQVWHELNASDKPDNPNTSDKPRTPKRPMTWNGLFIQPEWHEDLREAIDSLGVRNAAQLGYKLRMYRRRIIGGLYFDVIGQKDKVAKWVVCEASAFVSHPEREGDGGDKGDEISYACESNGELTDEL